MTIKYVFFFPTAIVDYKKSPRKNIRFAPVKIGEKVKELKSLESSRLEEIITVGVNSLKRFIGDTVVTWSYDVSLVFSTYPHRVIG